jgi:hypothetical protein
LAEIVSATARFVGCWTNATTKAEFVISFSADGLWLAAADMA